MTILHGLEGRENEERVSKPAVQEGMINRNEREAHPCIQENCTFVSAGREQVERHP